jgi:hypothetical protein
MAADIVVLVTRGVKDACGLAGVMDDVSTAFHASAFAVVPFRCMNDSYAFAHELGHLMGARHDFGEDKYNTPYPFSHGFVQSHPSAKAPGPWLTIMGAWASCPSSDCRRIGLWSTPDSAFDYYGEALGDKRRADNRQTLNRTASTVANFMCSSTRSLSAAP